MRAAALALLLVLGACSDGGSGGSSESGAPVTTAAAGAGASTGAGAGGATVVTTAPGADYCGLARSYARAFERFGQPGSSSDIRGYYRDATAAMTQALAVAPAELRPDLQVVSETLQALVAGLEAINYDFSRVPSLPPELITRLMSRQFVESSTRVAAYSRTNCGIS